MDSMKNLTNDLFIKGHRRHSTLADRIDASGDCWEWTGATSRGYGVVWVDGRNRQAHRTVWAVLVGDIPDGLTLDHLCRNRGCVNPDHLEPVTMKENLRRGYSPSAQGSRKTHCPHGHPYSGENLRLTKNGQRACRTCNRTRPGRANK